MDPVIWSERDNYIDNSTNEYIWRIYSILDAKKKKYIKVDIKIFVGIYSLNYLMLCCNCCKCYLMLQLKFGLNEKWSTMMVQWKHFYSIYFAI